MGMINRVPKGLLGVLDAKTLGRTPEDLAPVVTGVMDLTAYYENDIPQTIVSASDAAVAAVGDFAPITVPEGELWLVYAVSSIVAAQAAGDALFCQPIYFDGTGQVTLANIQGAFNGSAIGAGEQNSATAVFERPFRASSSDQFLTKYPRSVGLNVTVSTSVLRRVVTV